jgi:chemotaxis protein CheY-P-specific phosphatase CheC
MVRLSEVEVAAIREILNHGFQKAAESLAFFMNDRITIKASEFRIETIGEYRNSFRIKNSSKYVLTTQIIGEISGYSYLVFSESDTHRLFELGIPATIDRNSPAFTMMSNALLLELDNIVSASVITQFANILSCKMHGGVPSLWNTGDEKPAGAPDAINPADSYVLNFKSKFSSSSPEETFSPEFFWILSSSFIEKVKASISKNTITENLPG